MKNLIFKTTLSLMLCACFGFTLSASQGGGEVPKTVKNAFEKMHPTATDVEWEKEGENYEVEYEEDGMEKESLYDASGRELQTSVEVEGEDVPEEVYRQIKTSYPGWEAEDVDKISRDGTTYYEVEIENEDGRELELLFNEDGMLISKDVEDVGDDD